MSVPAPELLANHLFNQIGNLPIDEIDQARTLYFEIRRLREKQPADFTTAVALVVASLKVGRRDEAVEELSRAYGLKSLHEIVMWGALADLNIFIGRLDRGAELYGALRRIPGAFAVPQVSRNAANAALTLGDVDFLAFVTEEAKKVSLAEGIAGFYLSIIEHYRVAKTFAEHQRIVSSVLKDSRVWMMPEISVAYQDAPSIIISHWCLVDRKECSKLQDAIIDALRAYYQSVEVSLAPALSAVLHRVREAPKMSVPMALAS